MQEDCSGLRPPHSIFRRFRSGSLALASLDRTCRDQKSRRFRDAHDRAFDHSRSRWLGIGDLITEPEGPLLHLQYNCAAPCGPADVGLQLFAVSDLTLAPFTAPQTARRWAVDDKEARRIGLKLTIEHQ